MFGRSRRNDESDVVTALPLDRLIALRLDGTRSRSIAIRGITQLPGLAPTRLRGRGLDFDEMRPYTEGDDLRHIDWNVTARIGQPYTRLYREERERAVTVALDLRATMFTGSRRLKAVAAGEYAAALLWRVAANQDRAGALVFDDSETEISRPASRQRGVLDALGVIAARFDAASRSSRETMPQKLDILLRSINRLSRNAGLIVLITGCDDAGPDFDQEMAIAGRRQKLVVLRIADPLELQGLPPGSYAYRLADAGGIATVSTAGAKRLADELRARNAAMQARFEDFGVPYLVVASDTPNIDVLGMLAQHGIG